MPKISNRGLVPRVPLEYEGIQVNYCKNVECKNYGVPPDTEYKYPLTGGKYHKCSGEKKATSIKCMEPDCGRTNPIKNNEEIYREITRLAEYLKVNPLPPAVCPNQECQNHKDGKPVTDGPPAYVRYGKSNGGKTKDGRTRGGSLRYKCGVCKRLFSVNMRSTYRQKKPSMNETIFLELINKGPFQRIFDRAKTGGGTVYGKIDFIYDQCLAFAAEQERKLVDGSRVGFHRLYLSTDMQEYVLNWRREYANHNIKLTAIGTADNDSGFVFGIHLNVDPGGDPVEVQRYIVDNKENDKPEAFRKFARYWTLDNYRKSAIAASKRAKKSRKGKAMVIPTPMGEIRLKARKAGKRYNVESSEEMASYLALPIDGMQVHRDYLAYAHFYFLKQLLGPVFGKVRFTTDYDSGLRAACLTAFLDEIQAGKVDHIYAWIKAGMPKGVKLSLVNEGTKELRAIKREHPKMDEYKAKTLLMIRWMRKKQPDLFWGDWWIPHPKPKMNEPLKMMSIQTFRKKTGARHLANILLHASLAGVNRFFNVVRRRISPLERPTSSASTMHREYLQYGPYSTTNVMKLLEILRVYYNYVFLIKENWRDQRWGLNRKGEKVKKIIPKKMRKTAAMYLGLCDRPYTIGEIMNFTPSTESISVQENAVSA